MKRPEETLQRSCARFTDLAYPGLIWFAVPNQRGTRTIVEATILKGLGVKAGVADLVFCLPHGRFAAVELKAPKGKVSEVQQAFAERVQHHGGYYALARSLDEYAVILERWLVPLNWVSKVAL